MLNEIFGEENCVATIVWQKRVSPANDAKWFSSDHDLILVYAKDKSRWRPNKLARTGDQLAYYKNPDNDPKGLWNSATYTCNKTKDERPNLFYSIRNPNTGEDVWPKETAVWKYGADVTATNIAEGRLYWGADGRAAFPRIKLYLNEMDNVVPRSVWSYEDVGHTQAATTELKELFGGQHVFDSPKPVRLLDRIIEIGCDAPGDIVLDFFAGSGTTGHAAMARVAGGAQIRFILVQLPEPIEESVYKNIAEITRDRLVRARALLAERCESEADLGFRLMRLDTSNIRAWIPDKGDLAESLLAHVEHLSSGRSSHDVLYEVLLKLGLDLCVSIEERVIAGQPVQFIGGGILVTCLSERLQPAQALTIAESIPGCLKELGTVGDVTCVFRDSAFDDDVTKTNVAAILEQHGISTVRSL